MIVGQKRAFSVDDLAQIEVRLLEKPNWHDLALLSFGFPSPDGSPFEGEIVAYSPHFKTGPNSGWDGTKDFARIKVLSRS